MTLKRFSISGYFFVALVAGFILPLGAQADVKVSDELSIYGDGRARFEMDEQTRLNSGAYQDRDRNRFRYRLRAGFKYTVNDNVEFGGRLASGTGNRSPHIILGSDDNSDGGTAGFSKDSITIDKAYIKGKFMDGFAWFGKNDIPFWEQNEYFWDGDVTPEGIGLGYTFKDLGPVSITLQGGHFVVDECGWETSGGSCGDGTTPAKEEDATLLTYQGVVKAAIDLAELTAAYGVAAYNDGVAGTDKVSYSLASIQAKIKATEDLGIAVGYDYMKSDADDDDKGSVINLGASYKAFSAGLKLVDIETNAVSGFAQDDWPNYASNFEGYELNIGYKISKNMNVDIKRFDGERKDDSEQTETRNQINFNVSF